MLSKEFVDFMIEEEGFSATPYFCQAGHLTIGIGHKILQGERFDTITMEQALNLLEKDLQPGYRAIDRLVRVKLTQQQQQALLSFIFNLGVGAFGNSTLLKKLNEGDYKGAGLEFLRWNKYTDPKTKELKVSAGLDDRRKRESAMFLQGLET